MVHVHSSPDESEHLTEDEGDFSSLMPRMRSKIDDAFSTMLRSLEIEKSPQASPSRIQASQRGEGSSRYQTRGSSLHDEDGGGFLPTDDTAGGFLLSDKDESGGGFMLAENDGSDAANGRERRADSLSHGSVQMKSSSYQYIPLSSIPYALQSLDLPPDPDVLAVFKNAAQGWGGCSGSDQEERVSRKDWRAVCAVLMAGLQTAEEPFDQGSEAGFDDEDDRDQDDQDADEDDYVEGSSNEVMSNEVDLEDNYGASKQKARSSQRRKSQPQSVETRGPVILTSRQRKECKAAFALFFPEVSEEELEKQRLKIKDIARVAALLKEKLTAEEIIEMLEAFSTSPDKSVGLRDFEQMMMATGMA